jgi:hypothetical protein
MEQIEIKKISKQLFDSYVFSSRHPNAVFFAQELQWYANSSETILGVITLDTIDNDFAAVMLGRDEIGRFRAFNLETSFVKIEDAILWLKNTMKWYTSLGKTVFPQGDPSKEYKIFDTKIPKEKQHPSFVRLNNDDSYIPAKKIINNIMPYFIDIDGNFIEQFQTTGFDSRIWELYLFSYFVEDYFVIDRRFNRPDFILSKYGEKIAVEAVIVGRKNNHPKYVQLDTEEYFRKVLLFKETTDEMAIKFGSPLFSKVSKKYWELEHVQGIPFVIAIADFHDDFSMIWSHNSLLKYLYGYEHKYYYDKKGMLVISPEKIKNHIGSKIIPSGFFNQPNTENISGILFSSSGTISKFSRMAIQAGFGVKGIKTYRHGFSYNRDPNASKPNIFQYEVTERSTETWAEGLDFYHNPNAKIPLNPDIFPTIAHHFLRNDGNIESWMPEFHPYASITSHVKTVDVKEQATSF